MTSSATTGLLAKPKLWVPGDWNAFFGFGTNILVNLLTLSALLRFVLQMPDELVFKRILPAAASNRIYVVVNQLRKLGLKDRLRKGGDGYFLDPADQFVVSHFVLDPNDPRRLTTQVPPGFRLRARNASWKLYARCAPAPGQG